MIEQIVFYSLSTLVLAAAVCVVTMRNTVHSSLFLGLSLAGVAGLFAALGADFLFAAQVMVYVSGIAVLIMFSVMLLGRASDLHLRQVNEQWMAAVLICSVSCAGLLKITRAYCGTLAPSAPTPDTRAIGRLFMGEWMIPFELASLVLTAALLGAVFFSRSEASR